MYIHYSTGNNSGPRTLVRIVEVSVIGGVHFRRFHCSFKNKNCVVSCFCFFYFRCVSYCRMTLWPMRRFV